MKNIIHLLRNNFRWVTHVLLIESIIFGLTLSPVVAATTEVKQNDWVGNAVGTLNSGLNVFNQILANQQAMIQQNQTMNSLQITVVQDPYFPQCQLPKTKSNEAFNACDKIASPQEAQFAATLEAEAAKRGIFYDQMLSEAQKTPYPVGIQCLENARQANNKDIQDRLNSLTQLINQLKEQDTVLKNQLENAKKEMSILHGELNGKKAGTLNEETTDFAKKFDQYPSCKNVLSSTTTSKAGNLGLLGVRDTISKANSSGKSLLDSAYETKSGAYRSDLNKQIETIKNQIKSKGISAWSSLSQNYNYAKGGMTEFGDLKSIMKSKASELSVDILSAKKYLKENFDYTLPELDKNFTSKIASFESIAASTFKKKIINDCVTSADETGIGFTNEQILSGLQQQGGAGNSLTLQRYRQRLQSILDDEELFIEDKMDKIRLLQAPGGDFYGASIYIRTDAGSGTPFSLYRQLVSNCNKKYDSGVTSADNPTASSYKEKVAIAKDYISKVSSAASNFTNDLIGEIQDAYINCDDSRTEKVGGCTNDAMNPGKSGFCIKSAESCASNIESCYNNIDNLVKETQNKLAAKAVDYNSVITNYLTQRKQLLQGQVYQALLNAEWLGEFFNNTAYEIPNLNVNIPEKGFDSEYGLDLIGKGSLNFLSENSSDNIISNLTKLQDMMKKQGNAIDKELQQHIAKQKQAIQSDKAVWAKLEQQCKGAVISYEDQANQQQQEMINAINEQNQNLYKFCSKYRHLSQNPLAGCDSDYSPNALFEDSLDVASMLDPSVQANLGEYAALCASANNEALDYDSDLPALVGLCDKKNQTQIIRDLKKALKEVVGDFDLDKYLAESDVDKRENMLKDMDSDEASAIERFAKMQDDIKTKLADNTPVDNIQAEMDKLSSYDSEKSAILGFLHAITCEASNTACLALKNTSSVDITKLSELETAINNVFSDESSRPANAKSALDKIKDLQTKQEANAALVESLKKQKEEAESLLADQDICRHIEAARLASAVTSCGGSEKYSASCISTKVDNNSDKLPTAYSTIGSAVAEMTEIAQNGLGSNTGENMELADISCEATMQDSSNSSLTSNDISQSVDEAVENILKTIQQ